MPTLIATVRLVEHRGSYSFTVELDDCQVCDVAFSTIGGALDRARQIVLEHRAEQRTRIGQDDVP